MADKENLKDRNIPFRSNIGDGSHKILAAIHKREINFRSDKSERMVVKKEIVKAPANSSQMAGVALNIQNITKRMTITSTRVEETHKETSLPQRKNLVANFTKSSMLNTYLSRDKELRPSSKPKPKKDEEPVKRPVAELLQHSKSILQIAGNNSKMHHILNPTKKPIRRVKDANDASSLSNVSEVSEVSKSHKNTDSRLVDPSAFKSTDKNPALNFNKEKKNLFGKKVDSITKQPLKQNFTSVNKSKAAGSNSSAECTPEKHTQADGILNRPLIGNIQVNPLTFKLKPEIANKTGTGMAAPNLATKPRLKKEKLICLESLIMKQEGPLSGKGDNTVNNNDTNFLIKGTRTKKEMTIEEEINNFVQENQNGIYTTEMLANLIQSEAEYMPDPYYLDKNQTEITWAMRAMLIDWLVEVSSDFFLKTSTFHYAVNYIDRFLSMTPNVPKNNFQLVGLTAINLATKLEEVYVPQLADFAASAGKIFPVETIKKMELVMMKVGKPITIRPLNGESFPQLYIYGQIGTLFSGTILWKTVLSVRFTFLSFTTAIRK